GLLSFPTRRSSDLGNGLVVTRVVRGTAAYQYGLNVNDLLLTVNGERVNGADDVLKGKKPGDRLSLQVIRNGLPRTIQLILGKNDNISVKFEKLDNPSSLQEANYKAWMGL